MYVGGKIGGRPRGAELRALQEYQWSDRNSLAARGTVSWKPARRHPARIGEQQSRFYWYCCSFRAGSYRSLDDGLAFPGIERSQA
jgi:hypothetical protein